MAKSVPAGKEANEKKETVQLQLYLTKNSNYNRLVHKIVIANLGGPVKRGIKFLFLSQFYFNYITSKEKRKRKRRREESV